MKFVFNSLRYLICYAVFQFERLDYVDTAWDSITLGPLTTFTSSHIIKSERIDRRVKCRGRGKEGILTPGDLWALSKFFEYQLLLKE